MIVLLLCIGVMPAQAPELLTSLQQSPPLMTEDEMAKCHEKPAKPEDDGRGEWKWDEVEGVWWRVVGTYRPVHTQNVSKEQMRMEGRGYMRSILIRTGRNAVISDPSAFSQANCIGSR